MFGPAGNCSLTCSYTEHVTCVDHHISTVIRKGHQPDKGSAWSFLKLNYLYTGGHLIGSVCLSFGRVTLKVQMFPEMGFGLSSGFRSLSESRDL